MYEKVWRYLELEKTLDTPDFLSRLKLFSDLIFQPLSHLFFWVCMFAFPAILPRFGYSGSPSKLKMAYYLFTTLKMVETMFSKWSKMIEYYNLGTFFLVEHIKHARTPINYVINSSHPSHQLFKYPAMAALLLNNVKQIPAKHSLEALD